jgi:5-methyltetrahydrofolate--homocysteine methyltransferase
LYTVSQRADMLRRIAAKDTKPLVLLDGATGTSLWELSENKVPVWRYNLENPDIVIKVHSDMAEAGAQILLANTFGVNAMALQKEGQDVSAVTQAGVRLCRQASAGRCLVALSSGPLLGLMEPYGEITQEEAEALYDEVFSAGMQEKPDLIYLETFIDLEMLKIAARCARKHDVPLFCTMSFEKVGKTMMGNSVADMVEGLAPYRPDAIGLNCSLGPDLAMPVLRQFRQHTDLPLIFKPNAGRTTLVDGKSVTELDPDQFVQDVLPACQAGATYLGGCCGADASYVRKLHMALQTQY